MNTDRVVPLDWRVPKLDRPASGHLLADITVLSLALVSIVICCGILGREENLEVEDYNVLLHLQY